jgi:cystathionine beta-lyase
MAKRGPGLVNTLGIAACVAAYRYGRPWLNKLLKYLQGNIEYVTDFINLNLPKIKVVQPQGTFLVWIDCMEMGLENSKLNNFFKDEAKIWLSPGDKYGPEGEGFQRINIATSRSILEKAMNRIKTAYDVLFYERKANSDDKETDNQSAENLDNEVQ